MYLLFFHSPLDDTRRESPKSLPRSRLASICPLFSKFVPAVAQQPLDLFRAYMSIAKTRFPSCFLKILLRGVALRSRKIFQSRSAQVLQFLRFQGDIRLGPYPGFRSLMYMLEFACELCKSLRGLWSRRLETEILVRGFLRVQWPTIL